MDAIKALLKQIVDFWNSKDKRFKRNAIIIAAASLAIVIILSVVLNQVDYVVLYAGLDSESSAAVLAELDTQNVKNRVEGDKILVPAADADRLRLSLASEVKNGLNLDILAQGQGLGMAEKDKQLYRNYQLQGIIQNAIKTFDGVEDAQVILVIPDDSALVITADKQYATAGVILTPEDGYEISTDDGIAVAKFVEKAVKGLRFENISIMDNAMRIIDITKKEDDSEEITSDKQFEATNKLQEKLRKQVFNLLNPVFGFGRVSAEVNVVLNFDSKSTKSVEFKPVVGNKGIVRDIETVREKIENGTAAGGEPGTTTNTGGTTTYPVVNTDNGTYEKNTESIKYEINEIQTTIEDAKGKIENLSVAVVIDNTDLQDDITAEVKNMVAMALGVDTDLVSVSQMKMASAPVAKPATEVASPEEIQQSNQQLRFYILVGAVVFVVLLAMVLVFMGRKKPKPAALPESAPVPGMLPGLEYASAEDMDMETQEELAAIELVKDSSAKEQIGRLIEKNPELVANLLRTWLADEQE